MSLVLLWSDGENAHMVSDGMVVGLNHEVLQRDQCKFFRTASGVLIAACGQGTPCHLLKTRFRTSTEGFTEIVANIAEFVRQIWRDFKPHEVSNPLGVLVAASDAGMVRCAEISETETHFSVPGRVFVAWLAGAPETNRTIGRAMGALAVCMDRQQIPQYLRRTAEWIFKQFPNDIGGQIFEASLTAPPAPDLEPDPETEPMPEQGVCDLALQGSEVGIGDNSAWHYETTYGVVNPGESAIGFWWDQIQFYRILGDSITVPAKGSAADYLLANFNNYALDAFGFWNGQTLYFWAAYVGATNEVIIGFYQNAPATPDAVAEFINLDGQTPLYINWPISFGTVNTTGAGSTSGSTCFTPETRVKTPQGWVAFGEMGATVEIENQTGIHLADVIRHGAHDRELIALPDGRGAVTPDHAIQVNRQWIPAMEAFRGRQKFRGRGVLYNLHVRNAGPEDQHFIVEPDIIAHNFKFGNPA